MTPKQAVAHIGQCLIRTYPSNIGMNGYSMFYNELKTLNEFINTIRIIMDALFEFIEFKDAERIIIFHIQNEMMPLSCHSWEQYSMFKRYLTQDEKESS